MKQVCCEGGEMSAGCYHDHCTGPIPVKEVVSLGNK